MKVTKTPLRQAVLSLMALLALAPRPARALDCSRASSAAERAICGDKVLRDLEGRVSIEQRVGCARGSADAGEQRGAEQQAWLAQRDACGSDAACLKRSLEVRLDALAGTAAPRRHGPFVVRYERAPRWDIVYPVIVSGPSGRPIAALEAALERAREDGCAEDTGPRYDFSYDSRSCVVYADEEFFTVRDWWDFTCGGPYPDAGLSFTTYLVSSGEKLELAEATTDALTGDRILELARRRVPGFDRELDLEDCKYHDRGLYTLAVVEGGLLFNTSFPHAMRACGFDVTLPWADLEPFISPRGPLAQYR